MILTNLSLVSVIIPIHNGKRDTIACLKSLTNLSYPRHMLEIIIVDNHSSDGSASYIKKNYPQINILSLDTNNGFAKAVNKALRIAKGSYFFLVNNDVILEKNYLQLLLTFMEQDPTIGIAGGKIYSQITNTISFCGNTFNPWTGAIQKLPKPNVVKESQWIEGSSMLIKKSVVKKIGFFDPAYFYTFEDVDFCLRAREKGFKVMYYPKAIAWHKEAATIDRFGQDAKASELYKAKFYYIFHHCSLPQILSSTLWQFLFILPIRKFFKKTPYFAIRPMIASYWYNLKLLLKSKL